MYPAYQQNFFYPPHQEVGRVKGEAGAKAYTISPGSSTLVLDECDPIVWFIQTDAAGCKAVTGYKIEPIVPEAPVDLRSIEERLKKLEEMYESHLGSNGEQ